MSELQSPVVLPVDGHEAPKELCCSITNTLMVDPVIAQDGFSYEKAAIERWFKTSIRSPMTNDSLLNLGLTPNHTLKSCILAWKEQNQGRGLTRRLVQDHVRKLRNCDSEGEAIEILDSLLDLVKTKSDH